MAKVKARRTHREELPGIAVLRDSVASQMTAFTTRATVLDLDMEVDPNLEHLMSRDPDGFLTAVEGHETVGFAASFIRSRQCTLSELWVLPQHRGKGAGELLLKKALAYGESSGARQFLAIVPPEPAIQGLLLRFGFTARCPVFQMQLSRATADRLGQSLSALLEGRNATDDLLARRGQADMNRIDQLTRNVVREIDHTYWLKGRTFNAALVRQGSRIAGYGYGSVDQVGPVAGSSREAALVALGWALRLAVEDGAAALVVPVPAAFGAAVEALLDAGATVHSTLLAYGINLGVPFDRCTFGAATLP
jgi:GNAT superfamily N-acetyltransferase